MCATPLGTFRLVFLAPDFLAGLAMDKALQEQGGNQGTEGSNLVTPMPYGYRSAGALGLAKGQRSQVRPYFFLPATVLRAPRRVRALVRVR